MISRLSKLVLFILLIGCKTNKEFVHSNSSKFKTFYSSTLNENEFDIIFNILKKEFKDFPGKNEKKIEFENHSDLYSIKILLNKKKIRYKYESEIGYDAKINILKSELEKIKNNY